MGEIRFVGTGETCGYPYLVCKKRIIGTGVTRAFRVRIMRIKTGESALPLPLPPPPHLLAITRLSFCCSIALHVLLLSVGFPLLFDLFLHNLFIYYNAEQEPAFWLFSCLVLLCFPSLPTSSERYVFAKAHRFVFENVRNPTVWEFPKFPRSQ